MIMLKVFLATLGGLILSLSSCQRDLNDIPIRNSHKLTKIDSITIPFQSSAPDLCDVTASTITDHTTVSILNKYELSITMINYLESPEIYSHFKFELEGPNGLEAADGYLFAHPVDNTHLYIWNNATYKILQYDYDGSLIKSFEVTGLPGSVRPHISNTNPMIKTKNRLIFSLQLDNPSSPDFTTEPAVAMFNIIESQNQIQYHKTLAKFPKVYRKGFYGFAPFKYTPSICPFDSSKFLLSFPLDPKVYLVNFSGEIIDSEKITHPLATNMEPMKDFSFLEKLYRGDALKPSFDEDKEYASTHSEYGRIYKVGNKKLFVRISKIRPNISAYKSKKQLYPNYGITIFDNKLKVLGCMTFPHQEYNFEQLFNTSKGLHVLNVRKSATHDGAMVFDIFKVEKIPQQDSPSSGTVTNPY